MSADIKKVSDEQLNGWFQLYSQAPSTKIVGVPFNLRDVIKELLLRKDQEYQDLKDKAEMSEFYRQQMDMATNRQDMNAIELAKALGRENPGDISMEYIILKVEALRKAVETIVGPYDEKSDINCLDDAVRLLTEVLADAKWGKGSRYE